MVVWLQKCKDSKLFPSQATKFPFKTETFSLFLVYQPVPLWCLKESCDKCHVTNGIFLKS